MKAVCIVAHPDDCIIYGLGYIVAHSGYDWRICYLTYKHNHQRSIEMSNFWKKRSITTTSLGFYDGKNDFELNTISFNTVAARTFILNEIKSADIVLTHNANGEYGHPHHKFVHDCCKDHSGLVVFAKQGQAYTVPKDYYTLDELPMHAKSISQFVNTANHTNCYINSST
jgi:LmbE family N-acetylglucosaminyl deacetylase